MALDLGELVAALPEGWAAAPSPPQVTLDPGSLQALPAGRLRRMWTLGTMPAKVAAAYFAYWVRSSYATGDEKQRQLNEAHLRAAVQLLNGMGYLRGLAIKVGQALASYPNLLPEQFVEAFSRLHFQAPPMHFALIREQLRGELGRDPQDVFAQFDSRAFAAASLGQVHRARLRSGEAVAVKVQYPGIARTIRGDFASLLAILTPMRLSRDWDSIRRQLDDVRRMVEMETDYEREADLLMRGRAAFCEADDIVIPRVHRDYSTRRVLTMDLLDGRHLDAYLETHPSQPDADRYGTLIMRASFRLAHAARIWYADSSPGNYLFLRDGRLGLLDFGCCREFSAEEWDYYQEMSAAYRAGGESFRRALLRAADSTVPIDDGHLKLLADLYEWFSGYLNHEGPFDFSDPKFMQRGVDLMAEATRKRYFRSIPVNTWIERQLIGLRSLAFRLKARIDMKSINEQESKGILC